MSRNAIRARLAALDGDALLAAIVARLGEDTGEGSQIVEEYRYGVGLDGDADDDDDGADLDPAEIDVASPGHAAAFARFLEGKAREELHAALYRLSVGLSVRPNGRVEVWREMVVPADWPTSGIAERPLGVYWSYAPDAAEAHWGGGADEASIRVVVHGLVDAEGIDWERSVVANAAEEATVGEEREVRLLDSAEVELVGVGIRKRHRGAVEPVDIGGSAGETFPAGEAAPARASAPR